MDELTEQKKELFNEVFNAYELTETLLTEQLNPYDRRIANELLDMLHDCVVTSHKLRHGQRREDNEFPYE